MEKHQEIEEGWELIEDKRYGMYSLIFVQFSWEKKLKT